MSKRRPTTRSFATAIALVAGVTLVGASPASAFAHWSTLTVPNPPGASSSVLFNAVACPTTTSCFAVGSYSTASAVRSLSMHWDGRAWTVQATANPSGASFTVLTGIACPSTASCFAVGRYTSTAGTRKLAEHWNGHAWAIQPTPSPSGATSSSFNGIACPSTTSCFAVGIHASGGGTKTLVEHWNGSHWGIQVSPNPSTSTSTALTAISCPLPKSCFAVGSSFHGTSRTLVEHWNGSDWGFLATPKATNSSNSSLSGVSCPTLKSCFAVGYAFGPKGDRGLVQHWNGKQWGIQPTTNPAGSTSTDLTGVSCPSAKSCFAVGFPSDAKSLVQHWNGTNWGISLSRGRPGSFFNHLFGIACPSTKICFAVGNTSSGSSRGWATRYR